MSRPRAATRASADDLAAELRTGGLRATGPRLAILGHLRSEFAHPTPEEVHAALRRTHPTLSLSTVYQTLEAFLRVGLCQRVAAHEGRLRVDGTVADHDHAVCRACGSIFDLERPAWFRAPRPPGLPRGMRLTGVRIEFEVVCAACAARPAGAAAR